MGTVASIEVLCSWWTQASKEERFRCFKASIEGDENAPPLEALRIAIYVAEAENREIDQG